MVEAQAVETTLEANMDELKWEHLTDIQGRYEADILKAYFEEYGIEIMTFQESLGQNIYPTTLDILGNVQIFVSREHTANARKLLEEYNNAKTEEENEEK
jgi:hypothetical protein